MKTLSIASYNIHRCYGTDGRYDPLRIRQVLHGLNAQVVALQEVELLHDAPELPDYLCENTAWQFIAGHTLTRNAGHYGNALLTALPVLSVRRIDLGVAGREPRGALDVMLEYERQPLRVIATHLGLRPRERRQQIKIILSKLQYYDEVLQPPVMTVLMGDLNEWFLWGRPLRWLRKYFDPMPAPLSFPACCPIFSLDRIWVKPGNRVSGVKTLKNELTKKASDHLPIIAQLR